MSDKLVPYLLKAWEESPETKFYERRLRDISSSGFDTLKKQKYLVFDPYDIEKESYFDAKGDERFVRKVKGKWFATSESGRAIELEQEDINRYSFRVSPLLEEIKTQNRLYKNPSAVTPRIFFIGAKDILKEKVGVYIGLFADEAQSGNELLSLKTKTDQYHKYFVICPTHEIKSHDLLSKLLAEGITCLPFKETLQDMTIDFSKLKDKKDSRLVSSKTNKQIAEETTQDYLCADKVHIPGRIPRKKSNVIDLNNAEIKIGDAPFKLFLQLVVGAKKNEGGWVAFDTSAGEYQPFSNLRTPLKGALLKKDTGSFIENSGDKKYRLSIPPSHITYNREDLLKHPNSSIKSLVKKLTQETKVNGKRSKSKK